MAEIQIGTIVKPGDPNYALLDKATAIIQRFLDSFHSDTVALHPDTVHGQFQSQGQGQEQGQAHGQGHEDGNEDWMTLLSQDLWDWETGFWQGLAVHPSLGIVEPALPV